MTDLHHFFDARSIGFVGASPRSVAVRGMVARLRSQGFDGPVVMVNPRYAEVFGFACVPSLAEAPFVPALIVVVVKAPDVAGVIEQAGAQGVKAALVVSTGFADAGDAGRENVEALHRAATRAGVLLWGPGSFGFAAPHRGMSAFWDGPPGPIPSGNVALVAQSGGFANVFAFAAVERGFGFSYLIATGSELHINGSDYLRHVVEDEKTHVVVAILEEIRDVAGFEVAAARARELGKPMLALISGRSAAGQRATSAHSGALASRSDIQAAFLRRAGVLVIDTLDDLLETALLFAAWHGRVPTTMAPLFATISGGDCSLVLDLSSDLGVEAPELSATTQRDLGALMPESTMLFNPLDLGTRPLADATLSATLIERAIADPAINLVMTRLFGTAEDMRAIAQACNARSVPNLFFTRIASGIDASFLAVSAETGSPILKSADRALGAVRRATLHAGRAVVARAHASVDTVMFAPSHTGRISEIDALDLLKTQGLSTIACRRAATPRAAAEEAEAIGYPVVVKVDSPDIEHKSDCGGVVLDVRDSASAAAAFDHVTSRARQGHPEATIHGVVVQPMRRPALELIVGYLPDRKFGSAVLIGFGGLLAEVLGRAQVRLAPLSIDESMSALEALLAPQAQQAGRQIDWRGLDIPAAARFVSRFSEVVAGAGDRFEAIEVNPLGIYTDGRGALALDCLMVPVTVVPTPAAP